MKHILLRPKEAEELRSIIESVYGDRSKYTIISFYNGLGIHTSLLYKFLEDEYLTHGAKRFNFVLKELYEMFLSGDIRVKENKFYLRTHLPMKVDRYLNLDTETKKCTFNSNEQTGGYQTQFTQAEIDELIKKYGNEIKALEKIPVPIKS